MATLPTTERLALALELSGAPIAMIERARAGYYDDFQSEIAGPISTLVDDANALGLHDIAQRAADGEFDATTVEGNEWMESQEGQEAFRDLLAGR